MRRTRANSCLILAAMTLAACAQASPGIHRTVEEVQEPQPSLPLANTVERPSGEYHPKTIDQLLEYMASGSYRARNAARTELRKLLENSGDKQAEHIERLKKILKETQDPEVRHHLDCILLPYLGWEGMLKFDGRNLKELTDEETAAFSKLLTGMDAVPNDKRFTRRTNPCLFTSLKNESGKQHYVLIYIKTLMIPFPTEAMVYIFDSNGHLLGKPQFLAGYRVDVKNVEKKSIDKNRDLIVFDGEQDIGGGPVGKYYYALINKDIVLVRLENDKGVLIDNKYDYPNHTIGPNLPERNEKNFVDTLTGGTWAGKLAVLTWLGGIHLHQPETKERAAHAEDKKDIELAKKMLADKKVAQEVRKLVASEDQWIKEAAQMVLKKLKADK